MILTRTYLIGQFLYNITKEKLHSFILFLKSVRILLITWAPEAGEQNEQLPTQILQELKRGQKQK